MCSSTSPAAAVLLVEMMMMTVAVVRLCQCHNAVVGDGDDSGDDRRHGDILLCQLVSADTHTHCSG